MTHKRSRIALLSALAALVLVSLVAAGCGGGDDADASSNGGGGTLSLVAYSTPREAYEEIIPAFQETDAGEGVRLRPVLRRVGRAEPCRRGRASPPTSSRFSLEPDITRLIDAGLVDEDWNQNEYNGMVTDSVVVFAVRPGNPENIQTWDDLLKDGVEVITPEPVHLGRRPVEHHGRLRRAARAGQVRGGGDRVPARPLHRPRARPGQERARGAADVRRRQGRRHARLRERGDLRPAGRARRSTTSCPTRRS